MKPATPNQGTPQALAVGGCQNWQTDKTKMLRMLRNSKALKEKHNWSRKGGAGFIAEDIAEMSFISDNTILFEFGDGRKQAQTTSELNLRETEEAIKYLEGWGEQ